jgi:hypothetical protein
MAIVAPSLAPTAAAANISVPKPRIAMAAL